MPNRQGRLREDKLGLIVIFEGLLCGVLIVCDLEDIVDAGNSEDASGGHFNAAYNEFSIYFFHESSQYQQV